MKLLTVIKTYFSSKKNKNSLSANKQKKEIKKLNEEIEDLNKKIETKIIKMEQVKRDYKIYNGYYDSDELSIGEIINKQKNK